MKSPNFKIILWIILFLLHSGHSPISAQQMDVPARIQAAMYAKIFKYVPQLRDLKTIRLLVVTPTISNMDTKDFIKAFEQTDIKILTCTPTQFEKEIQNSDVIYFMPKTESYTDLCKKYKKLSITGIKKYTQEGRISLALSLVSDKPRLFVNIESLKSENFSISADILRLAQLY